MVGKSAVTQRLRKSSIIPRGMRDANGGRAKESREEESELGKKNQNQRTSQKTDEGDAPAEQLTSFGG